MLFCATEGKSDFSRVHLEFRLQGARATTTRVRLSHMCVYVRAWEEDRVAGSRLILRIMYTVNVPSGDDALALEAQSATFRI